MSKPRSQAADRTQTLNVGSAERRQNEPAIWLRGPQRWIRSRLRRARPSTLVLLCELQGLTQHPLRVTFIMTAIALGRRWATERQTERDSGASPTHIPTLIFSRVARASKTERYERAVAGAA